MLEKIQQAEAAIKDGDTRTGFEILRQVLAENPNSERAWWVMSGLVPKEQRGHCLEQVLRINPDNQLARETLEKLQASVVRAKKGPVVDYQSWLYAQRTKIYLTLLGEKELISATADSKLVPRIQAALSQGEVPDSLLKEKRTIPYKFIIRIRQIMSSLRVYFKTRKGEDSLRLELEDDAMADQVLGAIKAKLGPDFILKAEPMKIGSTLGIAAILIIVSGGITGFFYWGALEVSSGRAAATGSIRAQSIIRLLELLGPVGVAAIGAVLMLIALGISGSLLLKPPTVTELSRE